MREFSFLQAATDTADLSTYTFSTQNLGTADANRYIIVAVESRKSGASTTISSVTVGGITASEVRQATNNVTNTNVAGLYIAAVPTGTTGNVVVTLGATMVRCAIALYRAVGINPTAIDHDASTANSPTVTLDVSRSGFTIGAGLTGSSTSVSWSGLTENYDAVLESFVTYTGASGEFFTGEAGRTITATFGAATESVGVFASWDYLPQASSAKANLLKTYTTNTYENGYKYRRPVVIDNTQVSGSGDLTNFPVLFSTTHNDLRVVGSGGHVENSNGFDIRFELANGTKLNHEIEKYTSSTGALVAWIQVPTLDGDADTTVYIYYGNANQTFTEARPTYVWDSSYQGVWHMSQDPTAGVLDSTSYGATLTHNTMASNDLVSAKTGDGIIFDGTNEYLSHADSGSGDNLRLNGTSAFTISGWVNASSLPNSENFIWGKYDFSPAEGYVMTVQSTGRVGFKINGSTKDYTSGTGEVTTGNWFYLVGVFNGTTADVYKNGNTNIITQSFGATTVTGSDEPYTIANAPDGLSTGFDFTGTIDEVRVANVARSTDWIQTEYNNQNSPGSFYSFGSEETPGLASKANISTGTTYTHNNSVKANIRATLTQANSSKANIRVNNNVAANSVKASIYNPITYTHNNSAKANIAKTIGNINSTDTDLTIGGNGNVYGYRLQPSVSGTVQAIYFHLNGPSNGNTLYVALYNAATATTVGTIINNWSKATVGTNDQWVVIPVEGISLVAGTNYWLVGNNDVGATFHGNTDATGFRSAEWSDASPSTWTSPPTGVSYTNNEDLNAFMTYTALSTETQANSAKASIVATEAKETSAKANIVAPGQQPNSAKANILFTGLTQNNSIKGNIISTYYTGATYDWNYSSRALTESSVTVNGVATGRDQANSPGGEQPSMAFDGDPGTKWLQFESGGVPFWIQYAFEAGVFWRVVQYSITTANDVSDRDPKTWQLLASNTGSFTGEEVVFDTVEDGALSESRGATKTFVCDNPIKGVYRYYRLNITDLKNIEPANSCQIGEIALYAEAEYENRGYQVNG